MSTSSPTSEPEQAAPTQSFAARFAGVFISPRATFADVARRPDFVWPLVLSVIMAVLVTETMLAKIGMEQIIRKSLEQGGQGATMSAEQMEQAVGQGAKIASIFAHLSGVLAVPIFLLIVAALGLAITNAIFGAQLTFKGAFSITCYANLLRVVESLMALALVLFGDVETFNPQNPTPTNVGFFLNPLETSKPLLALASSIDLFTVWSLVLLGIGLSEATKGKVKALSIALTYFGIWLVWVLGKVGLAMLG